jgi:hypothetical protein
LSPALKFAPAGVLPEDGAPAKTMATKSAAGRARNLRFNEA